MRPIPEVMDLDLAFPTRAMQLMPKWDEIPDEFKSDRNKWVKVFEDWFFFGLKDAKWTPKEGVDAGKALRVIKACIGDFQPSHEHKKAGCACLLSEWFEDVAYQQAKEMA